MSMPYEQLDPTLQLQLQMQQAAARAYDEAFQRALAQGNQYLDADRLALQAANTAFTQTMQQNQLGLQAASEYGQQGLAAANLIGQLRGPRNAFQQQAVMSGLNQQGLSNAVGAIAGQFGMPSFQAPQANPQAATLGTMAEDLAGAGPGPQGWSPYDTMAMLGQGGSFQPGVQGWTQDLYARMASGAPWYQGA